MNESNKHIINTIETYLKEENTHYALFINGEWGIGKTYFLKNKIFEYMKEKEYEPRYISLNGISSLEDLDKLILSKLNPLVNEKSFFSKKVDNLEQILNENDEFVTFSHCKKMVLCLDDLERINVSILEKALGYINQYIEHEHIKTIFICDESRILDKTQKIKEKYIRYTLQFKPIIEEILSQQIEQSQIHSSYKSIFFDVFRRGKTNNIRTLLFSLDILNRIFKCEQNWGDDIKKALLFFSLFYSVEIKKGTSKDILDQRGYFSKRSPEANENSVVNKIHSSYFADREGVPDLFFESVATLICEGYLDDDKLKEEIDIISNNGKSNVENEIINTLDNPYQFENDRIIPYIQDILTKVEKGTFSISSYLKIYNRLVWLENFQLEGLTIDEKFLDSFKKGIDKTIKNGNIIESDSDSIQQYYYTGGDPVSEKTKILATYAEQQLDRDSEMTSSQKRENILSMIENAEDNKLFDILKNDKSFLLTKSDAKPIFDKLLSANPNIVNSFYQGVNLRYANDNLSVISNIPNDEKDFILDFFELLNEYKFLKPILLNKIPLQLLKYSLSKLIESHKLNKT